MRQIGRPWATYLDSLKPYRRLAAAVASASPAPAGPPVSALDELEERPDPAAMARARLARTIKSGLLDWLTRDSSMMIDSEPSSTSK